jgi:hypothetical protein
VVKSSFDLCFVETTMRKKFGMESVDEQPCLDCGLRSKAVASDELWCR